MKKSMSLTIADAVALHLAGVMEKRSREIEIEPEIEIRVDTIGTAGYCVRLEDADGDPVAIFSTSAEMRDWIDLDGPRFVLEGKLTPWRKREVNPAATIGGDR